jgi:hypothetical protein
MASVPATPNAAAMTAANAAFCTVVAMATTPPVAADATAVFASRTIPDPDSHLSPYSDGGTLRGSGVEAGR